MTDHCGDSGDHAAGSLASITVCIKVDDTCVGWIIGRVYSKNISDFSPYLIERQLGITYQ
jgi:hypothetical protein